MKKIFVLSMAVLFLSGLSLTKAYSLTLPTSLFVNGSNQASDQDYEFAVNSLGNPVTGVIGVGDTLVGEININTINSSFANVGGNTSVAELTGVFAVTITGFTNTGAIIWGSDPNFATDTGYSGTVTDGAIAMMFIGTNGNNFTGTNTDTNPSNVADTIAGYMSTAMDGSYFMTLGFTGTGSGSVTNSVLPNASAGESGLGYPIPVGGVNPLDMTAVSLLSTSTIFATSNFGVNLLDMNSLYSGLKILQNTPNPDASNNLVDFLFSQSLKGSNSSTFSTPFQVTSNTDISFSAVPEPATMALLGIGLLGLCAVIRRQKSM